MKSKQVLRRLREQEGRKRAERLEKPEGSMLLAIRKPTACLPILRWTPKVL